VRAGQGSESGEGRGLTQELATRTRQLLAHPSFSPPVGWGGEWMTGKTQFNKTIKEKTNTNNEYAKETIHSTIFFSLPNDQLCSQSPSSDCGTQNSWI